jgi:cell wall-associated NlpC family hydrolase
MEPWIDARPEFQRLNLEEEKPKAGDLIGLRLFRCLDHLGIMLTSGEFIHVLMHKRTTRDSLVNDPTWSTRLLAAWRPVEA